MEVNRISSDGAFIREISRMQKDIKANQTGPSGPIVSRDSVTVTDSETGVEIIIGQQPDGTHGIEPYVGDTEPPPVATIPVVIPQPGTIKVSWDGEFFAGALQPRDFVHVNVIGFKIVAGVVVQTAPVGLLRKPLESIFVTSEIITPGDTWEFALQSEDYNGNLAAIGAHSTLVTMQTLLSDDGITAALEALSDEDERLAGVVTVTQEAAALAQTRVDALLASGVNLAINGDFELPITTPATGWPITILSTVQANVKARSGTNILQASPTASAAYAFTDYVGSAKDRVYSLEMWVRLGATATTGIGAVKFNLNTLKLDGTVDTTILLATTEGLTASGLSTTTYTKLTTKYTVPADSTKIRFGPYLTGTGNIYLIDNFKATDITAAEAAQVLANQAFIKAGDAATEAGKATSAANGKNKIWYTDNAPAGTLHLKDDSWFDTNNDFMLSRWDGVNTWVPSLIGNNAIYANLDAGKMTIGDLDVARLKGKSVTLDKLVVSSTDNLIVGSDFSANGATWELGTYKAILPVGGRSGGAALRFSGATSTITSYNLVNKVVVDPDNKFRVSIWVKTNTLLAANKIRLGVRPYFGPNAQTPIELIANSTVSSDHTYVPATNEWTQFEGMTSALPANTTHVEFYLSMILPNTTGFIDVSSVFVTRAADGKLIVDGAINGKTITGALFQSVEAPAMGIKFDSFGIRAYNELSQPTFTLDSLTGNLTANGSFLTGINTSGILIDDDTFAGKPGVRFYTGTGETYLPTIFAADYSSTSYGPGDLILMGSEQTANSSGRTELRISRKGGGFKLLNAFGPYNNYGITMDGVGSMTFTASNLFIDSDTVRLRGKVSTGQTDKDTTVYGTGAQTQNASGLYIIVYSSPVPSGTRRPFVQIDCAVPSGVSGVVQNCTGSSFRFAYVTPANNNLSFSYQSVWTA